MQIICGPINDERLANIELPINTPNFSNENMKKLFLKVHNLQSNKHIGVLVSGGIDSAILYFALLAENFNRGCNFTITPFTILRKEGSRHYAIKVIDWIHDYYNLPRINLNVVGDNTLPEAAQVESGVQDILTRYADFVYVGIIESRPEHSIGWRRHKFVETYKVRYPLLNLQKSHVIDLYRKFNVLELLSLTHSCAVDEITPCQICNGCNERNWGFDQLRL